MKSIVATFEEPESSHSFVIATFDESEYPRMEAFFAEIKKHDRDYPGPHFSIENYTAPPHNPKSLEDFFSPPKEITPTQVINDDWWEEGPVGTNLSVIVDEPKRKPYSLIPAEFGTDTTLEPPDEPATPQALPF